MMTTMKTFLAANLLVTTLLLCRAQAELNDESSALENTSSSCFFAGNCDLSSCTSDCVCYAMDCPTDLSSCTENCRCDGGYCDMPNCVRGCNCYTGGCIMSAESESDGPNSSCQRVAGGYGDPCTKSDGTKWVNSDQPPADELPPGAIPADPAVPEWPVEMDPTSASALIVVGAFVRAAFPVGIIALLLSM